MRGHRRLITAAERFDELNALNDALSVQHQQRHLLGKHRQAGFCGLQPTTEPAIKCGFGGALAKAACIDALKLQFAFFVQGLQTRTVYRHIAYGVQHRLVIVFNQHVAGGAGIFQVGVQTTAVEQRQAQAGDKVNLLAGGFEQIVNVNGIQAEECFDIEARIKQRFRGIDLIERSLYIPAHRLQIRAAGEQIVGKR